MSYTIEKYTASVMEVIGFFGQIDDVSPVKPGEVTEHCYVAFTDTGDPIGMLISDGSGYVPRVAVKENYRRKGIAKKLFTKMAEDLSFETAELESRDDQTAANEFYQQEGWTKVSTRKATDDDGSNFELYEWEIPREKLV